MLLLYALLVFTTCEYSYLSASLDEQKVTQRSAPAFITLTSPILSIVDGKANAMDGEKIHGMKFMIQEIVKMQYGILDKSTNTRTGKYIIKETDNKHEIEVSHICLKRLLKSNQAIDITKELEKIKIHLGTITDANLESGRGSKELMRKLITEWSQKRNKPFSLLLAWSRLDEPFDRKEFRDTLTSLQMVDSYCTDLVQFLGDLQNSCPKAVKQYYELYPRR
jgi:hypothetical protein